jgi:predicted dehydrogenase
MKVAIIGLGNMGSKYVNKFDILNLDAVLIDRDLKKLEKFPKKFAKYTNLDEALKKENITHAFIVTDPQSHIPLAKKLLDREINVMVEKPPSLNPKELEMAIDLANKKNVVLSVSEIELKSNNVRNLDLSKNIEEIEAYRLNLGKGYINPLYDLAWHDLYIISYLFKSFKIKKVKEEGNLVYLEGETEKQDFKVKVAWLNSFLKREWKLKNSSSEIILNFVEDKIIYPNGEIKENDKKDKLELMIKEFLTEPSFESAFRALNILEEFNKFGI